eukprot:126989_1
MLFQMKRKQFISDLMKHLNLIDNKLKAPLGAVYTTIIKYDIAHLCGKPDDNQQDIWHNQPVSVEECDFSQIEWLLRHKIFDSLKQNVADKLIDYKMNIVQYVREKQIMGCMLTKMNRKTFATQIQDYLMLRDNKLRHALCQLYSAIVKYNLLELTQNHVRSPVINSSKNA